MATYLVTPDDYAGWNPTGRNFALISAAIGAIGLLSWLSLHRHLGVFRPSAASDRLFLGGLVWLGVGGFCLLAVAALGSITLSLKSRGTVSVTSEGVFRTVKSRTQFLPWSEIIGLVPMPYGGVTLISAPGASDLVIPRFLDDYRACIAEIKDHGIQVLPASSLRQKRKTTWVDVVPSVLFIFLYSLAMNAHQSHPVRIASFGGALSCMVWVLEAQWSKPDPTTLRWVTPVVFVCIAVYALIRIFLSW